MAYFGSTEWSPQRLVSPGIPFRTYNHGRESQDGGARVVLRTDCSVKWIDKYRKQREKRGRDWLESCLSSRFSSHAGLESGSTRVSRLSSWMLWKEKNLRWRKNAGKKIPGEGETLFIHLILLETESFLHFHPWFVDVYQGYQTFKQRPWMRNQVHRIICLTPASESLSGQASTRIKAGNLSFGIVIQDLSPGQDNYWWRS